MIYQNMKTNIHTLHTLRASMLVLLSMFCSLCFFINTTSVKAESTNPTPTKEFVINDYANILNQKTRDDVVTQSKEFATYPLKPQVVLMTLESTGNMSVDDYANDLIENDRWKAGQKGQDNGVIIIWAKNNNKNNVRIQVGYGLEDVLTDAKTHEILKDNYTDLKSTNKKDINSGLQSVYAAVSKIVTKKYKTLTSEQAEKAKQKKLIDNIIECIAILIFVIIVAFLIFYGSGGSGPSHGRRKNSDSFLMGALLGSLLSSDGDSDSDSGFGGSFGGGFSGGAGSGGFGGGGSSI